MIKLSIVMTKLEAVTANYKIPDHKTAQYQPRDYAKTKKRMEEFLVIC